MSAALKTLVPDPKPLMLDVAIADPTLKEVLAAGTARAPDGSLKLALARSVVDEGGLRLVRFELVDKQSVGRPSSA